MVRKASLVQVAADWQSQLEKSSLVPVGIQHSSTLAMAVHDRVAPRRYKAMCKVKDTEAIRLVFRKNYYKFRNELLHDITVLNSILYSKNLITDGIKKKDNIDSTLSVIDSRLQNEDVTKSTFVGFCEAVCFISKHLVKGILLSSGKCFTLSFTRELALLWSTSNDEELLEEEPDQNENGIGIMPSSTSMHDMEELRENNAWIRLAYEKTSENIQINKQLKKALSFVQDLRKEVQHLKAKLVFCTQRMKQAEKRMEAARQAEQNARQAERVSLKKSRQAAKACREYKEACQACEEARRKYEEAFEIEEETNEESEADSASLSSSSDESDIRPTMSLQELWPRQTLQGMFVSQRQTLRGMFVSPRQTLHF